jgi:hypothetical protein
MVFVKYFCEGIFEEPVIAHMLARRLGRLGNDGARLIGVMVVMVSNYSLTL